MSRDTFPRTFIVDVRISCHGALSVLSYISYHKRLPAFDNMRMVDDTRPSAIERADYIRWDETSCIWNSGARSRETLAVADKKKKKKKKNTRPFIRH